MTNEQLGTPDTLSKKHLPWLVAAIAVALVLLGLIMNMPGTARSLRGFATPTTAVATSAVVSIVALIVVLWRR